MAETTFVPPVSKGTVKPGTVQRKCACGGTPGPSGMCPECERKARGLLQRQAAEGATVPSVVHRALDGPGRPLDGATRATMEAGFGTDLSHVRLHTDAQAAASARAVGAHAYTVGSDIAFAEGKYAPGTPGGDRLLAHEIAHTVQQGGLQRSAATILEVSPAYAAAEVEADRAADAVLSGRAAPSLSPASLGVARKPDATEETPDGKLTGGVFSLLSMQTASLDCVPVDQAPANVDRGALAAADVTKLCFPPNEPSGEPIFIVDRFALPEDKGPLAPPVYRAVAANDQLQAVIAPTGGAQKQGRDSPETLRASWLQKVGWGPGKQAVEQWTAQGGTSDPAAFVPKAKGATCNLDHIIELQVFGTNVRDNIQMLDAGPNQQSGRDINQWLKARGSLIREAHRDPKPYYVAMRFARVEGGSTATVEGIAKGAGTPPSCIEIECKVLVGGKGTGAEPPPDGYVPVLLVSGAHAPARAYLDPKGDTHFDDGRATSRNVRQLVAGYLLNVYRSGPPAKVEAQVDHDKLTGRAMGSGPNGSPISLAITKHANPVFDATPDGAEGAVPRMRLKFASMTDPVLKFHYPWLSEGELSLSAPRGELTEAQEPGFRGTGKLKPSFPLLEGASVNLTLGENKLSAVLAAPPGQLAGFPFVRITQASLAADLLPSLALRGDLKAEIVPYVSAGLHVEAKAQGLEAAGDLSLHVPKAIDAKGEVRYRAGYWNAHVEIRKDGLKIPHVRDAALVVDLDNNGVHPHGYVELALSGHVVRLFVRPGANGWTFEGTAKLHPFDGATVDVTFVYAEGRLSAMGEGAFIWNGLQGKLNAWYVNGELGFGGALDVTTGRIKGSLGVMVKPQRKWTADGRVEYWLTDSIHASVGLAIDENRKPRFTSELRFDDITLKGTGFKGEIPLFPEFYVSVPIAGPVTLDLYAGMDVVWDFPPARFRDLKLSANFAPFDPDPAFDLTGSASLAYGGRAGFQAEVGGEFVLGSRSLAAIAGGLAGTGFLGFAGQVVPGLVVRYQNGRFSADGTITVKGHPQITFGLKATLSLYWLANRIFYRPFPLAELTPDWRPPGEIGYTFAFHYEQGQSFKIPDVGIFPPAFDASVVRAWIDSILQDKSRFDPDVHDFFARYRQDKGSRWDWLVWGRRFSL